jgi:hypothetical protein
MTITWEFIRGNVEIVDARAETGEHENYGILRAKVPGGWLVATAQGGPEAVGQSEHYIPRGICSLPDASHSWIPGSDH